MSVIVSFWTNTFLFVFQRVFSWFCAADEPVVSLKCGEDGCLETGSLEGLRARAFLPPCSGKTWIKRCPKIEDHGKLFISQRFYSCFPPSLFTSILSLQLKTHTLVLDWEVFLEIFLCVRESESRSRENESRRGVERGKDFFLSLRHSRLALFKAEKNLKENLWDKSKDRQCKGIFIQRFTFVL